MVVHGLLCGGLIDDILVYNNDLEEHADHLRLVLSTLREHQLYPKLNEYELSEIKFLSHLITQDCVTVDPNKVEGVLVWPQPTSLHEVRSFLGLVGYYCRFVEGFTKLSDLLTTLTRKYIVFI